MNLGYELVEGGVTGLELLGSGSSLIGIEACVTN
jgi:hypothetical protein